MSVKVDTSNGRLWRVRLGNPPLNLMDPELFTALQAMLDEAKSDEQLRALVVESAVPDFFMAHLDTNRAQEKRDGGEAILDAWDEFVDRFAKAPLATIASVRGRVRGIGNEFLLAFDTRFASREKAILAQPEIGASVAPGGNDMDWLPRLAGRSRALEIVLGANDFDADAAERYGWINRAPKRRARRLRRYARNAHLAMGSQGPRDHQGVCRSPFPSGRQGGDPGSARRNRRPLAPPRGTAADRTEGRVARVGFKPAAVA